jgi:hypothetical protein
MGKRCLVQDKDNQWGQRQLSFAKIKHNILVRDLSEVGSQKVGEESIEPTAHVVTCRYLFQFKHINYKIFRVYSTNPKVLFDAIRTVNYLENYHKT